MRAFTRQRSAATEEMPWMINDNRVWRLELVTTGPELPFSFTWKKTTSRREVVSLIRRILEL